MEEMMLTVMACSKLYCYLALQHRYEKTSYLLQVHYFMWPISFAADPSDRAVWGVGMQPLACSEIVGSNSTGGHGCLSVCCECCVLSGSLCDELITRPGVLPTAVCRCLRSRNLGNEEALGGPGPRGAVAPTKTIYNNIYLTNIQTSMLWLTVVHIIHFFLLFVWVEVLFFSQEQVNANPENGFLPKFLR